MSKHSSRGKRRRGALPALGFAGVSLVLASGASASTGETIPSTSQSYEIFLGEEEIFDVSLATFFIFDKENTEPHPLAQKLKLAQGGCGGCACGRCGGCGGRRDGYGGCGCGWGYGGCSGAPPPNRHRWRHRSQ
jgi:hypothetical protein